MVVLAFFLTALVGISLGLIGGGGSILMVPILVYVLHVSPSLATSYSLFIIGATSLVGAFNAYKNQLVHFKVAFLFGVVSITTVFFIRSMLLPLVPNHLFFLGDFAVTKNIATMVLFALLMLLASISMIKSNVVTSSSGIEKNNRIPHFKLFSYAMLIGMATGFLGAGGGFLLIPTLVLLLKMPMKQAVGTSLFIIALNSLVGFVGDWGQYPINWLQLISITAVAIIGIFIGGVIALKIDGNQLKKSFGWFVFIMGCFIIVKEFS